MLLCGMVLVAPCREARFAQRRHFFGFLPIMPTIAFDIASGNRDLSETARVCVFKETPRLGMARVLRGGGGERVLRAQKNAHALMH